MNESQNSWLDETPLDDGIWLDMLVDGELTQQQRAAFVGHVRDNNDWQRVATAFLDGQVLGQVVPFEPRPESDGAVVVQAGSGRRWLALLAMAACLIGGLMIGRLLPTSVPNGVADVPRPVPVADGIEDLDSEPVVASSSEQLSLPGLFQVKDTPFEAVYYADFSMPQYLLDALVLAGHKVSFEQEFLGYTESANSPAAVPINVVRIEKYGRLLALADTANSNNQ